MSDQARPRVDTGMLTGVSETALLTLNGRAYQANHPDAIIEDPMAIKLVDSIDFDFDKFGRKGQEMALRSLAVDRCAIAYLGIHPKATVVALAEGFQTSFWRLDSALPDADFHWVSVDLPPVIALRERLLPPSPRITNLAQSALDYTWMDSVDDTHGVFITAEGLLMYLQPDEAMGLITQCAKRFPGWPDVLRSAAGDGQEAGAQGDAVIEALPGTADAVQPFGPSTGGSCPHRARDPGSARRPDAEGAGAVLQDVFPALWRFPPTKQFRGAYTLLEFGPASAGTR